MVTIKSVTHRTITMRSKKSKSAKANIRAEKEWRAKARAEATRRINKANGVKRASSPKGKQPDTHVMVIRNNHDIKGKANVRATTIITEAPAPSPSWEGTAHATGMKKVTIIK